MVICHYVSDAGSKPEGMVCVVSIDYGRSAFNAESHSRQRIEGVNEQDDNVSPVSCGLTQKKSLLNKVRGNIKQ